MTGRRAQPPHDPVGAWEPSPQQVRRDRSLLALDVGLTVLAVAVGALALAVFFGWGLS